MKRAVFLILLAFSNVCCGKEIAWEDFDALMGKRTSHWAHIKQIQDVTLLELAKSLYAKNSQEQWTKEGDFKIPPVIHFIWLGPKAFPAASVENVRTWLAQNPGWKVKFWTDREREAPCEGMETVLIQESYFSKLARCYNESENWGEKSDVLRYEILLREGGVYVDHDANCLRPFAGMHRGYDFYCCLETPHEPFVGLNVTCGNGVIGARAGHPCIAKVVDLIANRWQALGEKYRGRDDYSRIEVVMQRTYIALTHALKETINAQGNTDIILPAAYFFSKSGIPSLYSKHFYATAWDDFKVRKSEIDKVSEKALGKIQKRTATLTNVIGGMFLANAAVLGICIFRLTRRARRS